MSTRIRLEKLRSLELLRKHRLPILPFIVLHQPVFKSELERFCNKLRISDFMIRTDGRGKFSPSINNATLKNDVQHIASFFRRGFTVFAMHPGRIHRNLHSANIMVLNDRVIIEVVGPGFNAHDLNRNGFIHETLILARRTRQILDHQIIGKKVYEKNRLEKIKDIGRITARQQNSYLLSYRKYLPLTKGELQFLKLALPKLERLAREMRTANFIACMRFINFGNGKHRAIFWDIYRL